MLKWLKHRIKKRNKSSTSAFGSRDNNIVNDNNDKIEVAAEAVQGEAEACAVGGSVEEDTVHILKVNPLIQTNERCLQVSEIQELYHENLQDKNYVFSKTGKETTVSSEVSKILPEPTDHLDNFICKVDREVNPEDLPNDVGSQIQDSEKFPKVENREISETISFDSISSGEKLKTKVVHQAVGHRVLSGPQHNESSSITQQNIETPLQDKEYILAEQENISTGNTSSELKIPQTEDKEWTKQEIGEVSQKKIREIIGNGNLQWDDTSECHSHTVDNGKEEVLICKQMHENKEISTGFSFINKPLGSDSESGSIEMKTELCNKESSSITTNCFSNETKDVTCLPPCNNHFNLNNENVGEEASTACEKEEFKIVYPTSKSKLEHLTVSKETLTTNLNIELPAEGYSCWFPNLYCLQLSCLYNQLGKLCTVFNSRFILTHVKDAPVLVSFLIEDSEVPRGCLFLWRGDKCFVLNELPDGTEVCFDAVARPNERKYTAIVIWQVTKPTLSVEPCLHSYVFVEELRDLKVNIIVVLKEIGVVSTVIGGETQKAIFRNNVVYIHGKKAERKADVQKLCENNSQHLLADICKLVNVDSYGTPTYSFVCSCIWLGCKPIHSCGETILRRFTLYEKGCGNYVEMKQQSYLYFEADVKLSISKKGYSLEYKKGEEKILIPCSDKTIYYGNKRVIPTNGGKVKAHISHQVSKMGEFLWKVLMVQVPDTSLVKTGSESSNPVYGCEATITETGAAIISKQEYLLPHSQLIGGSHLMAGNVAKHTMELAENKFDINELKIKPVVEDTHSNLGTSDNKTKSNLGKAASDTAEKDFVNDIQKTSPLDKNLLMDRPIDQTLMKIIKNEPEDIPLERVLQSNCNCISDKGEDEKEVANLSVSNKIDSLIRDTTTESHTNLTKLSCNYETDDHPNLLMNWCGELYWIPDSKVFKIFTEVNGRPLELFAGQELWCAEGASFFKVCKHIKGLLVYFDAIFGNNVPNGSCLAALWVGKKPYKVFDGKIIHFYDVPGIYCGQDGNDMKFCVSLEDCVTTITTCSTDRIYTADGKPCPSIPLNFSLFLHLKKILSGGHTVWMTPLIVFQECLNAKKTKELQRSALIPKTVTQLDLSSVRPASNISENRSGDLSLDSVSLSSHDSSVQLGRTLGADLPRYIKNFAGMLMLNELNEMALFCFSSGTALWISIPKNGCVCADGRTVSFEEIPLGTGLMFDAFCDNTTSLKYVAVIVWIGIRPHHVECDDGTKYFYDKKGTYCGATENKKSVNLQLNLGGRIQTITCQNTEHIILPDGNTGVKDLMCGSKISAHLKLNVTEDVMVILFIFTDEDSCSYKQPQTYNEWKISNKENSAADDTVGSQNYLMSENGEVLEETPVENIECIHVEYLTLEGSVLQLSMCLTSFFECDIENILINTTDVLHYNCRSSMDGNKKSYLLVCLETNEITRELIYHPLILWHGERKGYPYVLLNQKISLLDSENKLQVLVLGSVQNDAVEYCSFEKNCAFTSKSKWNVSDFCTHVKTESLPCHIVVEDSRPVTTAGLVVTKKVLLITSNVRLALSSINTFRCTKTEFNMVSSDSYKVQELIQIYEERRNNAFLCKGGYKYHLYSFKFDNECDMKILGGCLQFYTESNGFILCGKKKSLAVCHIANIYFRGRNITSWNDIDKKYWKNFFAVTFPLEEVIRINGRYVDAMAVMAWSCSGPSVLTVHTCDVHDPVVFVYKNECAHNLVSKLSEELSLCASSQKSNEKYENTNVKELQALDCKEGSNIFSFHDQILQCCGLRKTTGEVKYFDEHLVVCTSKLNEMVWCHLSDFYIKDAKCGVIEDLMQLKKQKCCLIVIHSPAVVLGGKTVDLKAVLGFIEPVTTLPGIHNCSDHNGILLKSIIGEELAIAQEVYNDIQILCEQSDECAAHLLDNICNSGIDKAFLSSDTMNARSHIQCTGVLVSVNDTDPNKGVVSVQHQGKEYYIYVHHHNFLDQNKALMLHNFIGCPLKLMLKISKASKECSNFRVVLAWRDLAIPSVLSPDSTNKFKLCGPSSRTEGICCPRAFVIKHFDHVCTTSLFKILEGKKMNSHLESNKVSFICSQGENNLEVQVLCCKDSLKTLNGSSSDDDSPWCILVQLPLEKDLWEGVGAWKGNVDNIIVQVCDIHKAQLLDVTLLKSSQCDNISHMAESVPVRRKYNSESVYNKPLDSPCLCGISSAVHRSDPSLNISQAAFSTSRDHSDVSFGSLHTWLNCTSLIKKCGGISHAVSIGDSNCGKFVADLDVQQDRHSPAVMLPNEYENLQNKTLQTNKTVEIKVQQSSVSRIVDETDLKLSEVHLAKPYLGIHNEYAKNSISDMKLQKKSEQSIEGHSLLPKSIRVPDGPCFSTEDELHPEESDEKDKELQSILVLDNEPQTLIGCLFSSSYSTYGILRSGSGYILFTRELVYHNHRKIKANKTLEEALSLKCVNSVIVKLKQPIEILTCQVTNIALLVWTGNKPLTFEYKYEEIFDMYRKKWKVEQHTVPQKKVSNASSKSVIGKHGEDDKTASHQHQVKDRSQHPTNETQLWNTKDTTMDETVNFREFDLLMKDKEMIFKEDPYAISWCYLLLADNEFALLNANARIVIVQKKNFYIDGFKLPPSYPLSACLKNVDDIKAYIVGLKNPICTKRYVISDIALLAFVRKMPQEAEGILKGWEKRVGNLSAQSFRGLPRNLPSITVPKTLETKSANIWHLMGHSGILEVKSEMSEKTFRVFFNKENVFINKKPIPEIYSLARSLGPLKAETWGCSARWMPHNKLKKICGFEVHYLANIVWYGEKPSKNDKQTEPGKQCKQEQVLQQNAKLPGNIAAASGETASSLCSLQSDEIHGFRKSCKETEKTESVAARLRKQMQNIQEGSQLVHPSTGAKQKMKQINVLSLSNNKNMDVPRGHIVDLRCQVGQLRLESGDHVSFSREKCFLYGICLNKVDLRLVLSVEMEVDYELTDDMKDVKGVWAGSTSPLDSINLLPKLRAWCEVYSVPHAAADLLMMEAGGLPSCFNPTIDLNEEKEVVEL
ncbi:hypothetical protein Hamer_G006291 [Homarus americanus]|uniref:Uncharacterized protein n=1 Tax=Homarus americanus TaxID=6706 RepID=A0A8J5JM96_HOMAM|nr:hypothetical protein Hamer_G006291 [Homarus americanus]